MEVPVFIFECLQKELLQLQMDLLERVANKYQMDKEDLYKEFLQPIRVTNSKKVYICKKQQSRPVPLPEERCMARVWNRGKGGQCSRGRCAGEEFCSQHLYTQKHGRITDPPPTHVYGKSIRVLYK